ncbi:hypothetical protein LCGC14_2540020 [marine sediment metagenome]|uniref:Holliday junction resolvase-related domain-containing protein n=1 Tax=marine sediment metagenome TaxID=412755 RepID=A0A0F9D2I1_9ZZZZ
MDPIYWIFIGIILILKVYILIKLIRKNKNLTQQYTKLLSQKKSSEVRLGQISEQIAPFLEGFSYDTRNTKFLGQPIDLICFEPDKVVFVEVKTGKSQLSEKQKHIKNLIKTKQVFWEEFRLAGDKVKPNTNNQDA